MSSNGSDSIRFEQDPATGTGITIPPGAGYVKQGPAGTFASVAPVPSTDLNVGTGAGTVAAGNDTRFPPAPSGAGKLLYDTGAAYAALAAGLSTQVLKGGAAPGFGAVSTADVDFLPVSIANGGTGLDLLGRIVFVKTIADLGTPSGGYYPQIADVYFFVNNAAINLGTDKLKITSQCQIHGNHRSLTGAIEINAGAASVVIDGLFQTSNGATAVSVIQCQRLVIIKGRIAASGQIGVDTSSGNYSQVTLNKQNIVGCAIGVKVGGIAGNRYVLVQNGCSFNSNTIGMQIVPGAQRFGTTDCAFLNVSGALLTHMQFTAGIALLERVLVSRHLFTTVNAGDVCISATPSDFSVAVPLEISQTSYVGPGIYWSGFSANNKEVYLNANTGTGIKNSFWRGFMGFQNGASITTVVTKDVYYPIAGTFVAGDEQLLNYAAGVVTNNSGRTLTINARAEAGGTTSNPDTWAIGIVKNSGATFDPAAPGGATLIASSVWSAGSRVSMTVGWQLTLADGETLRPMVTNKSANGRTLTAEFCSLVLAVTG